jgi:hypothetical protein
VKSVRHSPILSEICIEDSHGPEATDIHHRGIGRPEGLVRFPAERVFETRAPYAIGQADMPFELFQAMDVPMVSNQWWAAVVSAKRLAPIIWTS